MGTKTAKFSVIPAIISLIFAAIPASSAPAPVAWYQVELLIFEPVVPNATNEKWPVVVEEPAAGNIVELSRPGKAGTGKSASRETPVAFQLLNSSEHELDGVARSLERNGANKVLLHIAWRQPLEENADSPAVHVHSGLNDSFLAGTGKASMADRAYEQKTGSTGQYADENLSISLEHLLDGTVTLILTRYLHLKTHIVYTNPEVDLARQIAEQDTAGPAIEKYILKESRRVKRQEIHYIDHPYFGMLAKVTRYEPDGLKKR